MYIIVGEVVKLIYKLTKNRTHYIIKQIPHFSPTTQEREHCDYPETSCLFLLLTASLILSWKTMCRHSFVGFFAYL